MVALTVDTALGVAAVVASLSGLVMTIFSYMSGRKDATRKAEEECHRLLMAEQRISENLSLELHELRMRDTE
jgi:hypothetical protein